MAALDSGMRGLSVLLSAAGMVAGVLLWRTLAGVLPVDGNASSMAVRLGLTLAALAPSAAILLAMTLAQAGGRFLGGTIDPTLGRDGRFLLLNQRAITNSIEQLLPFALFLLTWAAGADAAAMPPLLALGAVFALARLAFWIGYLITPILRAPGMAASFAANIAAGAGAFHAWLW